jgi:hypothetical protein
MTTIEIELETGIHTNILNYAMGYILRKCFLTVHKEIKSMQNKEAAHKIVILKNF